VDLLDTSGRVIELKSAARKPSEVSPDHRFEVATYRALRPHVSGEARVNTLVKTKTPQLVEMPYTVQSLRSRRNRADVSARTAGDPHGPVPAQPLELYVQPKVVRVLARVPERIRRGSGGMSACTWSEVVDQDDAGRDRSAASDPRAPICETRPALKRPRSAGVGPA
jgi:hypothetical protein